MRLLQKLLQGKATTAGLSLVVFTGLVCMLYTSHGFLCLNKPVQPCILIVEGWLDEQSLLLAKDLYTGNSYKMIITTGIVHTSGYHMGSAGKTVFNVQGLIKDTVPGLNRISLSQSGTSVNGVFPHFRIYIDSVEIAQAFSQRKVADFTCQTNINAPIKNISILFDNDTFSAWRDRNLDLYTLSVNNQVFHPGNCEITYFVPSGKKYSYKKRFTPDAAHDASYYMIAEGIKDSEIVPVVTKNIIKHSRTYSTAIDVRSYLKELYPENIPPVTVVTRGIHARRTWVSYQKAFGKETDIGILSLPDDELTDTNWYKTSGGWKKVIYELTGLLYATVLL